jgi:flagellar biosynthetic protein FlhB
MNAPVCVGKGVDNVALKIREIAEEHNIPIVWNPPFARTLHAGVDIDKEIPVEHYQGCRRSHRLRHAPAKTW